MKLLHFHKFFKQFLILIILIYTLQSTELWVGIDAGVGFTKFTNIENDFYNDYYKAKMRPGFLSSINYIHNIHRRFSMFSVKYRIGYNQQRPALIDENGAPVTAFNKTTGEIDSTGEKSYAHEKYSLNTAEFFIQPLFSFSIQQKRFGLTLSPGIGVVYRFKIKHYFENFGDPVEISNEFSYNKIGIPIIGSIGIFYSVNETIQLSLNNSVTFGTKYFFEEQLYNPSNPSHYLPSLKIVSYQVVIGIIYRFYSST